MKTIFLSVGDASGDEHCAALVREVLRRHPDWKIVALSGPRSADAGAQLLGSTQGLGVIGFTSALAMVPRSWRLKEKAFRWLESTPPDAVILCDWGGFNTRILSKFEQLDIPVLYYFPPRSWQKEGDAGTQIAPLVDAVATPFEWSAQKLQRVGANAHWVGHPVLEKVESLPPCDELRAGFGFSAGDIIIALLPGSRNMELGSIAPHLRAALPLISQSLHGKKVRFVVGAAMDAGARLKRIFSGDVTIVEGRTLELLRAADFGIIKSGTSTLEAAALDLPQIVVYDAPALIHWQVNLTGLRRKIPFVAMPNIILGRMACPELLGENCRAPLIARELLALIESSKRTDTMRQDYKAVRRALGAELPLGATRATADLLETLM